MFQNDDRQPRGRHHSFDLSQQTESSKARLGGRNEQIAEFTDVLALVEAVRKAAPRIQMILRTSRQPHAPLLCGLETIGWAVRPAPLPLAPSIRRPFPLLSPICGELFVIGCVAYGCVGCLWRIV